MCKRTRGAYEGEWEAGVNTVWVILVPFHFVYVLEAAWTGFAFSISFSSLFVVILVWSIIYLSLEVEHASTLYSTVSIPLAAPASTALNALRSLILFSSLFM
jgi:hypothetical protein